MQSVFQSTQSLQTWTRHWPKYVISMDRLYSQTNIDGIKHIHLRDFLKMTTLVWCHVDYEYYHIIKGLYATCSSWHIDPCCFPWENGKSPWCKHTRGYNITGDQRWNRWGRGRTGVKALFTFLHFYPFTFSHSSQYLWARSWMNFRPRSVHTR